MSIKKIILYSGLVTTLAVGVKLYNENKHYHKFMKEIERHEEDNDHSSSIVAHRGFSSLYVENSMESVTYAFNSCCVDEIEIDVRLTEDNELVLFHNKYINLNCEGTGKVEDKTLEELETYHYNNCSFIPVNNESPDKKLIEKRNSISLDQKTDIATLDEVLTINSDKTLIIDVKINKNIDNMVIELGETLSNYNGNLNIKIQSSNDEFLEKMKRKYPNYFYQIVISTPNDLSYLEDDYNGFVIKDYLLNNKIIDECLENGKSIYVWTINTYEDYVDLKNKINDNIENITIISDNPDVMCYLNNCSDEKLKKLKK